MFTQGSPLYYFSALIAIIGTVGYHCLIKKIPPSVDPVVSILGIYIGVIVFGFILLPFVYSSDRIVISFRQLGWVQAGIALSILLIELGFILMYRSGWDLSLAYVVTGFVISLVLMFIGAFFLSERLSLMNLVGVLLCIIGVAMIGYSDDSERKAFGEHFTANDNGYQSDVARAEPPKRNPGKQNLGN